MTVEQDHDDTIQTLQTELSTVTRERDRLADVLRHMLGGNDVMGVAELHYGHGLPIAEAGDRYDMARTTAHRKVRQLRTKLSTLGLLPRHWRQPRPGRPPKPPTHALGEIIPFRRDEAADDVEESDL